MNDKRNFQEKIVGNSDSIILNSISWLFGMIVYAIGIVNIFWGNDLGFGVFLLLLSFVYFLPVNAILQKIFGFTISKLSFLKFFLGVFIVWAALGVGELFDKIDLLLKDLNS